MNRMVLDYATVLDGIGIALCLVIIGYLIYSRVKTGRMVGRQDAAADFGDHMLQCMVSQQIRSVLMAVTEKVCEQLQSSEAGSQQHFPAGPMPAQRNQSQSTDPDPWDIGDRCERSEENRPHESVAAVSSLLETGMGIADISRSIRRPVAEIELCAWLAQQRLRNGNDADPGNRRQ